MPKTNTTHQNNICRKSKHKFTRIPQNKSIATGTPTFDTITKGKNEKTIPFSLLSTQYKKRRQSFFWNIISGRAPPETKQVTLMGNTATPLQHYPRRQGRPKRKWANQCTQELWITHLITSPLDEEHFDQHNKEHEAKIQAFLRYWEAAPWTKLNLTNTKPTTT